MSIVPQLKILCKSNHTCVVDVSLHRAVLFAMKTKITTNIAEAMRCFSIVSLKKQRLESPYTASELSVSTFSLEDSATTALNLSRPSASPEVGVSHVLFF